MFDIKHIEDNTPISGGTVSLSPESIGVLFCIIGSVSTDLFRDDMEALSEQQRLKLESQLATAITELMPIR